MPFLMHGSGLFPRDDEVDRAGDHIDREVGAVDGFAIDTEAGSLLAGDFGMFAFGDLEQFAELGGIEVSARAIAFDHRDETRQADLLDHREFEAAIFVIAIGAAAILAAIVFAMGHRAEEQRLLVILLTIAAGHHFVLPSVHDAAGDRAVERVLFAFSGVDGAHLADIGIEADVDDVDRIDRSFFGSLDERDIDLMFLAMDNVVVIGEGGKTAIVFDEVISRS